MKARSLLLCTLFAILALTSCSGDSPNGIVFTGQDSGPLLSPGLTAELQIVPVYADKSGSPSAAAHRDFSENPVITADNPGIKILSVRPNTRPPEISCIVIIRASEDMLSSDSALLTASWAGFEAESTPKIKKQPALYIGEDGVITDPAATDAMMNKSRKLPAGYIPEDLVRITVPTILSFEEVNHLRRPAAEALSRMFRTAEEEMNYILSARSGYRSYKTQVSLFDSNVRAHGREYADKFSAQPGTSEHQSGLAMDITAEVMNYQLEQSFGETPEGRWTAENAHRFGFIIRYPEGKEGITGYAYEPWHLRYVGKTLAGEIFSRQLCLEEYYFTSH